MKAHQMFLNHEVDLRVRNNARKRSNMDKLYIFNWTVMNENKFKIL